ncbi:transcription regulator [Diaporthe amygdali]|uniref:transcription regulator n=1 Tax=Phomopsis amygdali TaxID=1214568 RepID=UPI0022FE4141|nr:transcription regulator [Diaporthe amygdali]KAJ0125298.1 transcription regulator [Diaporthe amygdali]
MTSQAEPIALDQKSLSLDMATSTATALPDERNSLEVNGHVTPADGPDATDSATPNHKVDASSSKDDLKSAESPEPNQHQNKDAFATNQHITAMTPPAVDAADAVESTKPNKDAEESEAKDTEMVDAPAESAQAPSPPAEPAAKSSPKAEQPAEPVAEQPEESDAPVEASSTTVQSQTAAESAKEPVKTESSNENDKEMSEAPVKEAEAGAEQGGDTQATATSEAPASDAVSPSANAPKSPNDESQEAASVPVTVDTSMTDAPSQSSSKIAREREEDVDDEPLAKRVRTSGEDGQQQKAAQAQSAPSGGQDAMAIDPPSKATTPSSTPAATAKPAQAGASVPLTVNGKSRKLNDPALANNAITAYQNREIKKVLALVKKTKSGQMFRSSVQTLWPGVWEQYRSLIKRPVDISFIEQNLRDNKYPVMADFRTDVELIIENATKFNGSDHDVTRAAKATVDGIYIRLAEVPAEEPVKPVKQDIKQMPTRHAEPRHHQPPPPKKESRPVASSPAEKVSDSPVFAVPASGVPTIRRDSTKNAGDRPKRPIHPPKNKDLGFQPKNTKNKRKPEMKFCEEVLKDLKHQKNWTMNQFFLEPVDPVALNIPTYHSVIKQPMDLGTMTAKLDSGEYESANAFKADFQLMIKNCTKFNPEGHLVHSAGKELEKLFDKKWSEKAAWMSKHAQATAPAAAATSPRGAAKDDEEEEDESEPEQESSVDIQEAQRKLDHAMARLKKENDDLNKQLFSDNPDSASIDLSRTVIQTLQDEIIKRRAEVNSAREKKPSQASKPSKKKATAGTSSGSKKAANNAGPPKKASGGSAKKPVKKRLTDEEKEIVSDAIGRLDGNSLTKAIDIIKKDTNLTETDDDELELDMEQLSDEALVKLFDLVLKAFPTYKDQLKKQEPAPTAAQTSAAKSAAKKKNKPMGKAEQERKLEQLKALKDSYKRPGSGSQEPVPSIEPNETAHAGHRHDDSDDASSSEEE